MVYFEQLLVAKVIHMYDVINHMHKYILEDVCKL